MAKHSESIIFDDEHAYTYLNFVEMSKYHGTRLKSWLPPGCKCAILCKEEINTALSILSAWYAGLVIIPLSLNYGKKHYQSILALTKPDVIIVDREENDCDISGMTVYNVVSGETNIIFNEECAVDNALTDVAAILCTSGTTGVPKGALISNDGLIKNILAIDDYFEIDSCDTIAIARPLYHCAVLTGEFLVSLYKGLNIGFLNQKYSPIDIVRFCIQKDITVLCGTPTLLRHISLLSRMKKDQLKIRVLAMSGEPLKKDAAITIRSTFCDCSIYNVYGLTEASPRVSFLPPSMFDDYSESVGYSLKGISLKITKDGRELDTNQSGMIMIQTPSVMKGYYNNPEATQKAMVNGWLISGDIGYIDNNGLLYVLSRADDMIIKGGMNIYPREIENQLECLPVVAECSAYGVETISGTIIAVDIVLNSDCTSIKSKELFELFATVLPEYQMPTQINIVNSLNKNASGKIIKKKTQIQ